MRYRSQTHELIIPVTVDLAEPTAMQDLVTLFERTYEDTYGEGSGFREAGIEVATFRVAGIGHTTKPSFSQIAPPASSERRARKVYDVRAAEWFDVPVLDWDTMQPAVLVPGPAIIEHPTTTVYVASEQEVQMDHIGNLVITSVGR
jgi:N-methylhydantoinase A